MHTTLIYFFSKFSEKKTQNDAKILGKHMKRPLVPQHLFARLVGVRITFKVPMLALKQQDKCCKSHHSD